MNKALAIGTMVSLFVSTCLPARPSFGGAVPEVGTFGSLDPMRSYEVFDNAGPMAGPFQSDPEGRLVVPFPTGENKIWIQANPVEPTPTRTNTPWPTPTGTQTPSATPTPFEVEPPAETPTPTSGDHLLGLDEPLSVTGWDLYR